MVQATSRNLPCSWSLSCEFDIFAPIVPLSLRDDDLTNNNNDDDAQDGIHEAESIAGQPTHARSWRLLRVLILRASTVLCLRCLPAQSSYSTHTTRTPPCQALASLRQPCLSSSCQGIVLVTPTACLPQHCWPLARPLSRPPLVSACCVGSRRRRLVCTPARGSSPPNPQPNISHTPWFDGLSCPSFTT